MALRPEVRKVRSEDLYPRRLAARALELVLERYQLTGVALRWNADDPAQVMPGPDANELRFYADGWDRGQRPVALVFLLEEGARARILVGAVRDLVRSAHRKDLRPEELGIRSLPGEPDLDVQVELEDVVAEHGDRMRTLPQKAPAARRARSGNPRRYRGALGAFRR